MNALDLHKRPAGRAAAMLLAWAFTLVLPSAAHAARIENTARVSYSDASGQQFLASSNTVVADIRLPPTKATLGFRRLLPEGPGDDDMPLDGGQCRIDDGSYQALPPLDQRRSAGSGAPTQAATGFYIGETMVVVVADGNRNIDPGSREYVELEITAASGDSETLRLHETGPDTGVFAAAIPTALVPPDASPNDCVVSLFPGAEIVGRYSDQDYPEDQLEALAGSYSPLPADRRAILLTQEVSKQVVAIGDFLQYTLVVKNIHDAPALEARIRDLLPAGLRYRPGSLRVGLPTAPLATGLQPASAVDPRAKPAATGGAAAGSAVEPELAADGRTLLFPVGDLDAGESVTATFVAEVGPGARGPTLVNHAVASASGALSSNETDTVVRMRDELATSTFTIIGRVLEAATCSVPVAERRGVPNVRVMLDDGTFTVTDENGGYHFEGVRPGTHVAQLDPATLPPGLQPAACLDNTRFAGSSLSQFVEAQGGTLARADFMVAPGAAATSTVGARLQVEGTPAGLRYAVELDGGRLEVSHLRAMVVLPDGASLVPGSARLDGGQVAAPTLAGNVLVFDLGNPGSDWLRRLAFEVGFAAGCPDGSMESRLVALFDGAGEANRRTPLAEVALGCPLQAQSADSGRSEATFQTADSASAASPFAEQEKVRKAIPDTVTAAGGGDVDWFAEQQPGYGFLFPASDYNPRSPATRVVFKHLPGQRVRLRINGEEPGGVHLDGLRKSTDGSMHATIWRALPLHEGDNLVEADVLDASGTVIETLERNVYFAGMPVRAQLVPEQSILVADGMHEPVLAVRMLDRRGRPVRAGIAGEYSLAPPYLPAQTVRDLQARQIGAGASPGPQWVVEGDDGIAYIELQPTTVAGLASISFSFAGDDHAGGRGRHLVTQELEAWLEAVARDWIVVGFAKGSVGYATLADNMQPLQEGEEGSGVRAEGQVSLYAKGRVLGKWLLTMAYDSDKPADQLHRRGQLSTIDPGQYYMLYGDGTRQGYDASSTEKLYLKLERGQFYALFGDFQTGLDRGELTRYQRILTGLKVEYRGPLLEFNGFAARTSQSFARDELQGDGTSGLYRLSHGNIVLNGERVRIETRSRHHSEQIIETRELARHIDYDIDYANGTLFFREPVASRDFDFNPVYIVVEYETHGSTEQHLNGGGRLGVRLLDDRLQAGVTLVRDEDMDGRSDLAGVDMRLRVTPGDELRAEVAATRGEAAGVESRGNAWLLQWDHRSERYDLMVYARRSNPGFGLGQQNGSEAGMAKAGLQGQWRIGPGFVLQGEAYRLENLANASTRDAVRAELAYRAADWSASAGLQWARDEALDGRSAESRQVTLGASRYFLDRRLELNALAELGLGGKNDSVDFPTRLQVGAGYRVNDALRLLASQEFTDGEDRDTSTTRVGFELQPWKDATFTSTLNQSRISEYGPRSFALFGLNQKFMVNERWSFDVAVDSSQAFSESGDAPLVVDPAQPIQPGGIRDGGALTEEFTAISGGATFRTDLWMWNARAEARQGDSDRHGFTTAFLRQVRDGIALAASAQAFSQRNADGSTGLLANAQLSWAYRPLGSAWSMLDKLEFRIDEIDHAEGSAMADMRSARIINNFVLNYASDAWQAGGDAGGVLDLYQRSQLSLYYGSRYVLDSFGDDEYSGYSDILGAELRFDLTPEVDIGLRASVLHSWNQHSLAWAFGPSVGFTPFANAWVSVGFNLRGFRDRDFEASHYTAEGAYLVFRMKFDQGSLGLDRRAAATR